MEVGIFVVPQISYVLHNYWMEATDQKINK